MLESLCAKIECHKTGIVFTYPYIYWGSVFSTDRGFVYRGCDGLMKFSQTNWIGINEKHIRDYRFDLESEVNDGR